MPEFRHDSTAMMTIAFMISVAAGMPSCPSALTNGDWPTSMLFHGWMVTSSRTEPT